jgi:translation initiation factor 5
MINIPSYIKDSSYRYKMPKMVLKQESRLNGVKINIFNLDDVSKSLRVSNESILKFMCTELGASSEKTSIIKGMHDYDKLLKCLDKFIEKYVLCKKCQYPETSLFSVKKELKARCRACGSTFTLDSTHRAGVALLKNLPKNMSEIEGVEETAANDKDDKKKKDKKKKTDDKDDEEEEKAQVEDSPEELELTSDEIADCINKLQEMVSEGKSNADLLEELRRYGVSLNFGNDFKYYILMGSLFSKSRNIVKNWKHHEKAFLELVKQDGELGGKRLLQSFCQFFGQQCTSEKKYAPTFMKLAYD